jgi:hypothetical protein
MKKKQLQVITQEQIDKVWGNANFGHSNRMGVVQQGLLKCASGYYQGYTSRSIITELGLITPKYRLTALGRVCLWEWFSG